ncbi:MAG: DNA polymerase domain-containing protein [Thermoplasmata archaeon]
MADDPPAAWLLDLTESPDGQGLLLWTKDGDAAGRVRAGFVPFRLPVRVAAPRAERAVLEAELRSLPEVADVVRSVERPSVLDDRPRELLVVTPRSLRDRLRLARTIDRRGDFHRYTLYDVDVAPVQAYGLAHGLYPFAPLRRAGDGGWEATAPAERIDLAIPPLRVARLALAAEGRRRRAPPFGPIASIRLGEESIEGGSERDRLEALPGAMARADPDILWTDGGDRIDLPWLSERARAHGLGEAEFVLGRAPHPLSPSRPARTVESYGRLLHRPATYDLPGRCHIDRESAFLSDDVGLAGLIEASRLSRLRLVWVARQSPGSWFSALEVAEALRSGRRIPWKKTLPERFRPADHLVVADRGGTILRPPVGVFGGLDEFDFVSLFPQIMVRHNLSIETLDCRCCPRSPEVAPGLGYRSCTRRVGLLPRTIRPLLERRAALKAAMRAAPAGSAEHRALAGRVRMLKWILVTAFGYQGYRNARFGRIENHEAINAYARALFEALIPEAEAAGYRVVHGIVDSLWLRPGAAPVDPEGFARSVGERHGLPLSYEGRYRWIVFLPSVGDRLGVPNRYYGCYESGEVKLRGIGSRRHDTPGLVRRMEAEVLQLFRAARDPEALRALLPKALARADRFAERVAAGDWPAEELVIARRVRTLAREARVATEGVGAQWQAEALGEPRAPGETIRYLIRDRASRSWRERVRLADAIAAAERYDAAAYRELLARELALLLGPLGVRVEDLRRRWGIPPPRPRSPYRSGERPGERPLVAATDVLPFGPLDRA